MLRGKLLQRLSQMIAVPAANSTSKKAMANVKLNNGTSLPAIGLGLWMTDKGKAGAAVKNALEIGYRHIDSAPCYFNENEIGEKLAECLKEGKIKRENLYIVSNLWCSFFAKEDVIETCKSTLKNLQIDYLDLYLVYLPYRLEKRLGNGKNGPDKKGLIGYTPELMRETWQEMEKLVELGLVKSIGVSNFTCKKMTELLEFAKIRPVCNQVELHPFLPQHKLLKFCKERDIVCLAYCPFGAIGRASHLRDASETVLIENDVIVSVAKKYNCSAAQVLLAWGVQRGTVVLPRSVRLSELEENLESADLILDADDINRINDLKRRARYVDHRWAKPEGMTMEEFWDGEYLS